MIKRVYEFLFYAFYKWSARVNGKDNFHVYYASLMLGLVLLFNIVIALIIFGLIIGYPLLTAIVEVPKFLIVIVAVVYFGMHYYYFRSSERYLRVIDEHDCGGGRSDVLNKGVAVYVMSTFLILVTLLFFQGAV